MKVIFIYLAIVLSFLQADAQPLQDKENMLRQMTAAVLSDKYPGIHSISISVGDSIQYEHYFNGYNRDSLHDSRSSFKSVTSLLVGIAIDKGFIKSTAEKVYDYFPEYAPFKNNDPRKKEVTIQHLLDMQSGFDCEEFNGTKDCEDEMAATNDWVKFALNLPIKDKPGIVFAYTSCDPIIISGIIKKAANMSVMDFAGKYLFDPLGITRYKWTTDPSGNGMTAGSFNISPADMLKIGRLVQNDGKWKGRQLISKKWIRAIGAAKIPIPGFSFAQSSRSDILIPQPTFYGNYWYREVLQTPDLHEDVLFASGNGGQYIFIIKRLHMVVVFTQGNYGSWKAKQAFDLLGKYIIPAFSKKH